jgi:hypothetical protein
MESISLTSKILHRVGSLGGQSPKALGMPADFYWENGDREHNREADVRSQKFLRRAIYRCFFALEHIYVRGPKCSMAAAVFCLLFTTLTIAPLKKLDDWMTTHEAKVKAQEQKELQAAQAQALTELGPVDLAHCSARLDDFNGLDADASKWSDSDKTMGAFRTQCLSGNAISADNVKQGQPAHYHARKYDPQTFAVVNGQTCSAHLTEINTMASQPGWNASLDADDVALNRFASNCLGGGWMTMTFGANGTATYTLTHR